MPENYGCRLAESTQLGADLLYLWSACMIKEMYTYNKLSFLSQIKKLFKHLPSPGAFSSVCPKGFESNSYRFCTTSLVISRHNLCCLILSIEGKRRAEQFDSASLQESPHLMVHLIQYIIACNTLQHMIPWKLCTHSKMDNYLTASS